MRTIQYVCILILVVWLGVSLYKMNISADIFCISVLLLTSFYWAANPNCTEHPITTFVKKIAKVLGAKGVQ